MVLALLWLDEFLLFWIDGVAGHPVTDWRRWLAVPISAAFWPLRRPSTCATRRDGREGILRRVRIKDEALEQRIFFQRVLLAAALVTLIAIALVGRAFGCR